MKYSTLLALLVALLLPGNLFAQVVQNDSVPSTREEKNRNVMLNARNDRDPIPNPQSPIPNPQSP